MMLFILLMAVLFGVLAWHNVKLAGFTLAAVLPSYLLRFEILGVPSTLLEVLVLVFLSVWFVRTVSRFRFQAFVHIRRVFKPLRVPLALLAAASLLAIVVAPDTAQAIGIWKAYIVEPLLLCAVFVSLYTREDIPNILKALSVSVIVLSAYAVIQRLTGIGLPSPWDIEGRVTSVFTYPNALGLFLGPILAALTFAGYDAWKKRDRVSLVLHTCAFTLGSVAIILSETEAAWIAVPAAVFVLFFLHVKNTRARVIAGGTVAVILLAVLLSPLRHTVIQKLTLQDYSGSVRTSQWSEATAYLADGNQILGAGFSGYPSAVAPYHTDTRFEIFQYPHNILLNTWMEMGLLGVMGFMGFMGVMGLMIWRRRDDLFVLAAGAGLLQMLIHGLVDVPYFKNDLAVLTWVLIAIVLIAGEE